MLRWKPAKGNKGHWQGRWNCIGRGIEGISIIFEHWHNNTIGSTHGFTDELIKEIIINAANIFSLNDILSTLPIFSTAHARFVLGIFQDLFEDTECADDEELISTLDCLLSVSDHTKDDDNQYLQTYFDSDTGSESDNPELSFLLEWETNVILLTFTFTKQFFTLSCVNLHIV